MRLDDVRFLDSHEAITFKENRLPHWQQLGGKAYFVTFRLADSVPQTLLRQWDEEFNAWKMHHPEPWSPEVEREYHAYFSTRFEQCLDEGHGSCALRDRTCAEIVSKTLGHFEGTRSVQLAWVIMPNHVHALFALQDPWPLDRLVASWKRHSALEINRLLHREGALWQRDYFDRLIRDESHLCNCVRYIKRNPQKARLRPGEYLHWESDLAKIIE
jgi:putative transposase